MNISIQINRKRQLRKRKEKSFKSNKVKEIFELKAFYFDEN